MQRGSMLLLLGLALAVVKPPLASGAELSDPARVAALIERLDAVSKSDDVLPLHALDLSLRKAVERELAEGLAEAIRGRALRLESAARIGSGVDGLKRDEAYRTPVSSWVDPADAPPAQPQKRAGRKSSPAAEADFERRRRAVLTELSQLDGALDEGGVSARRDLLVRLLEITRQRDAHRKRPEAAGNPGR